MMKAFRVLVILLILTLIFPRIVRGSSDVVGFSSWKNRKVQEAQSLVSEIGAEVKRLRTLNELPTLKVSEARLQQAKENLGVSKELTAHDYWVLFAYPNYSSDKTLLFKAAKTLKPNDMVDILEGYSRRLKADESLPSAVLHDGEST